jgi:hypothetical protein
MTLKAKWIVLLVLVSAALVPASLSAQGTCNPPCPTPGPSTVFSTQFEISPYAGFIWPGQPSGLDSFQNNQLLGVRGGFYVTSGFELGGNYSWNNHFQPKSSGVTSAFAGALGFPQGNSRAHIWEAEFTYNFGPHNFGGANIKPYVVGGAGGLTTQISNPSQFTLNVRPVLTTTPFGTPVAVFVPNDVMTTSETFFTFSYGGGFKAERLAGPLGFFGDIRGRTIPNFFTTSFTYPELSAGLTFSWGER